MSLLPPDERAAIIDAAMQRKFGSLLKWLRPTLLHTFGPNDLNIVENFETKLRDTKNLVSETLSNYSDEAIQAIGLELNSKFRIEESEFQTLASTTLHGLLRNTPPPVAFGFGHPKFQVDFDYWGQMPKLAIHEALMLSVGADPASVSADDLTRFADLQKKGGKLWSANGFLLKRLELFRRHFTNTGWGFVSETPSRLKAWIDSVELPVHPEFYATLSKRTINTKTQAPQPTSPSLIGQERETLLKLVAAMACEQYGYDPSKERSDAPSRIREDIELVGLTMDSKTIRKWLKEASELVDPSYWPKQE